MLKDTIRYYAVKLAKSLLIFLPVNIIAALAYCLITKNMSIVTFSNVLTIIGGAYLALGGLGFMGGMSSEIGYQQNFSRSANQRNADNADRNTFNIAVLSIGISTMVIAFAVLALQAP